MPYSAGNPGVSVWWVAHLSENSLWRALLFSTTFCGRHRSTFVTVPLL